MSDVTIVGSGASAVHFAQTALERGASVTMIDVGRERPAPVRPDDSFDELKRKLDDPWRYFLGARFEGTLFPGAKGEYYGFPPHKDYIFEGIDQFAWRARGFEPLVSFARGGLAEAWTGASLPFNDDELADFPFGYDELGPFYDLIADRIGVSGERDDLARFMPVHANLRAPLDFDAHSAQLYERYRARRTRLNDDLGCFMGRSRAAVLRDDHRGRKGCDYLGRCLWGCPRESLYTPHVTLRELALHPRFGYRGGLFASHFASDGRRVRALVARDVGTGAVEEHAVDELVLAAGTLATSKIFLDSLWRARGEVARLDGLMDNRQVLVPFVNLSRLCSPWSNESYQYHQLALGFANAPAKEYVHALVTTLKSALIHPIAQSVPLDLRTATWITRHVHGALGIVNVNFHDTRRPASYVTIEPAGDASRLVVHYEPAADELARRQRALARVKSALWSLGCLVPPGMAHVRPMGASVHYSGTLPMSRERRPLTVAPDCRSHDFDNLVIADGATFPFLPAKNLTFTLMANAARAAAGGR